MVRSNDEYIHFLFFLLFQDVLNFILISLIYFYVQPHSFSRPFFGRPFFF